MRCLILLIALMTVLRLEANTVGLRGGGRECVKRFVAYGQIINKNLHPIAAHQEKLAAAINSAQVVAVDEEYIIKDGEQYYAINEPSLNKISLSLKWCNDSLNPKLTNTAIIVLHEYLGLSEPGLDKNYVISSRVFEYTLFNSEELFYLVQTNGLDKSIINSKPFTTPIELKSNSLKLQNPEIPNQTALLVCNSEDESYLLLEITLNRSSFSNYYKIKSYEYCMNKLYEFVATYDESSNMSFTIGLDSRTIYEINLVRKDKQ